MDPGVVGAIIGIGAMALIYASWRCCDMYEMRKKNAELHKSPPLAKPVAKPLLLRAPHTKVNMYIPPLQTKTKTIQLKNQIPSRHLDATNSLRKL